MQLIDANELKELRDKYIRGEIKFDDEYDLIDRCPTVDAVLTVHGRWIKDNDSFQTDDYYCCYFDYTCSECGEIVNDRYKLPNYCPDCGAKMDGKTGDK